MAPWAVRVAVYRATLGRLRQPSVAAPRVIELIPGNYLPTPGALQDEAWSDREGCIYARKLGLVVSMRHGLHYTTLRPISAISGIERLLGHAVIAARFFGPAQAVKDMALR